jgi:hypothetical protein
MAHTVDSKEKGSAIWQVCRWRVQSGALSRAEIYQRNEQSRPQAQDKERGSSNKTNQTSRSNSEGTATEDKTVIDFLGGGHKIKDPPQDHKWCKVN